MEKLPGNLTASVFYSRSANFQPDASRKDIVGGLIPSPSGKTEDYGIAITALNRQDRLQGQPLSRPPSPTPPCRGERRQR
jgi:hypothetical protein